MYADKDYATKSELRRAVQEGNLTSQDFYQPNGDLYGVTVPQTGKIDVEGPHYPKLHRWYAEVWFENGKAVRVR